MGGGQTQSMLVAGILARYTHLAVWIFANHCPKPSHGRGSWNASIENTLTSPSKPLSRNFSSGILRLMLWPKIWPDTCRTS